MNVKIRKLPYSVAWNCGLIVLGTFIQAIGYKALGEVQGFVPGGLFGISTLIHYLTGGLNTGLIYLLLNIPMFIIGYIYLSKRFLGYSALAMLSLTLFFMLIDFRINIEDQLYAAVTFGVIIGTGAGMVLRSLGSNGGLDVAGVILYQKFNIGLGKFFFFFNFGLFSFSFLTLDNDLVIASMIEREAKVPEDRAKISRVIHNRLFQTALGEPIPLQIDATVLYGRDQAGIDPALPFSELRQIDTSWNTYTRLGLPATPIANPGRASIQAAAAAMSASWSASTPWRINTSAYQSPYAISMAESSSPSASRVSRSQSIATSMVSSV